MQVSQGNRSDTNKFIQNGLNTEHPGEKLSHKMYNNLGVLPRIKNYGGYTQSSNGELYSGS